MKNFSGKVAAITGAGSGIGQATAIALAEKGCHLSLSDVNDKGLAQTLEKLRPYPVKVTVHHVDVGDRAAVYQYAEDSVKEHGKVNLIINNAGVGLGETVEAMSYENFEWLMNINFWGVVHGCRAFLRRPCCQHLQHIRHHRRTNPGCLQCGQVCSQRLHRIVARRA